MIRTFNTVEMLTNTFSILQIFDVFFTISNMLLNLFQFLHEKKANMFHEATL